ncbi:MAG: GT2 family glycosyltransferase, partial [Pseudohongiellaceae bacterium]
SGERLAHCVASVLAQRPVVPKVVVVDNASGDNSAAGLPDGVELIRRTENDGYAPAVAIGLAATDEPFVFTLNPDTVLEPDCLSLAGSALDADLRAGAVAPAVLQLNNPELLDASGIGLTSLMGQINWDHGLALRDTPPAPRQVLGPLGGAALWRRIALERAGGFSHHFFLYWEDMDMALRLNRAGYICRTVPEARVHHEGSGIVGRWSSLNVFYMVRNHWQCLLGALPGPLLLRYGLAIALAPLKSTVLYARRGKLLPALGGLICGAALAPRAILRRRYLPRSGNSQKAAERIETLLAEADSNRLAMKFSAKKAPS